MPSPAVDHNGVLMPLFGESRGLREDLEEQVQVLVQVQEVRWRW